ncbi:MAG: CsbD family protein [Coriobacteriia bacterium]
MNQHKAEEFKGRVKEALGNLTDDEGLEREGKVDQGSARTKVAVGRAADKIKDVVNRDKD